MNRNNNLGSVTDNSVLPFTVNYTSNTNEQISCQNNINVLPNGPLFPSKPLFPSAIPPSLTQFPSTIQTYFINVKNQATICSIRCSSLIVDSGTTGSSVLRFNNLPEATNSIMKGTLYNLMVDEQGNVYKSKNFSSRTNTSIGNDAMNLSLFDDPLNL